MPPQQCANPLFLQWLEELRDSAREKGLKVAEVYNKGCRAIAACPVAYERPVELAPLQGIGPKTIKLLESKLKAHCEATGQPYPASPPRARPAPKRQKKGKETEKDPMEEEGDESDKPSPPKKRKAKAPRAYIPAERSGPAGILIGMIVAAGDSPDDSLTEQLTRGEIVRHAQPFCDSSYDHSERGTWVTAWNGMKTLVNKGYVSVQGMPHRYCLTEAGFDVGAVLRNLQPAYLEEPQIIPFCQRGDDGDVFDRPPTRPGPGPSTVARRQSPSPADPLPSRSAAAAPSRRVSSSRFGFWYIDAKGNRVEDVSAARTRLDPIEFVTLRQIQFLESQEDHPIVNQLRLVDEDPTLHESGASTLCAYFVEEEAPPKCSKFDLELLAPAPVAVPVPPALSRAASAVPPARTTALSRTGSSRPRLSSQLPLPGEHRESPDFQPSDSLVFHHGTYEVILVLDTREVESRNNRDRIAESLERKGVKVETRALRLGDMCWVARRLDGYGAEEEECVLDFVVERKRLDDLVSSIRDGRYSEQCFRLGQSGIGNVFYIVEDYQKAQRMQYQGKQIMTAKSQVQVINGFFLKETHKLADTIDYLVTMTRVIKESVRDLHVIPSRFLSRTTYTSLQTKLRAAHPDRTFLTSYEAYQELNKKSNLRTTKEYLARMLLVVRGMSPERVSAVLDVWETPRALWEAMKERHAQGILEDGRRKRGPEFMFADMVPGEGRRKIGDALSKALWYAMWGKDDAPPQVGSAAMATAKKAPAAPAKATVRKKAAVSKDPTPVTGPLSAPASPDPLFPSQESPPPGSRAHATRSPTHPNDPTDQMGDIDAMDDTYFIDPMDNMETRGDPNIVDDLHDDMNNHDFPDLPDDVELLPPIAEAPSTPPRRRTYVPPPLPVSPARAFSSQFSAVRALSSPPPKPITNPTKPREPIHLLDSDTDGDDDIIIIG